MNWIALIWKIILWNVICFFGVIFIAPLFGGNIKVILLGAVIISPVVGTITGLARYQIIQKKKNILVKPLRFPRRVR